MESTDILHVSIIMIKIRNSHLIYELVHDEKMKHSIIIRLKLLCRRVYLFYGAIAIVMNGLKI